MHIKRLNAAFTLVEVVIAMAIFGIVAGALMTAFLFGTTQVALSRDNVVATQILTSKMESLRLIRMTQLGNLPTSFQDGKFSGTLTVQPAPFRSDYSGRIRLVTIRVTWGEALRHSREWSTLVSRDGMQNYIEDPKRFQQPSEKIIIKI